jgi:hypothetical protein
MRNAYSDKLATLMSRAIQKYIICDILLKKQEKKIEKKFLFLAYDSFLTPQVGIEVLFKIIKKNLL